MPKLEDYKPDARIFALFISRSKHGKSCAAASFPKPYHQWDFDDRFDGVVGAVKPFGFLDPNGISFERFFTQNGFEPFQKALDELDMKRITMQFPYKTVELASLTSFMQALINSSHKLQSGKKIGMLRMSGPGDFNFEVTGMRQLLDYLHILPCHVICSAHVIDKWGKPKTGKPGEEYAANEIIGEKLCLRDQPGEVITSCFSNVFRFEKEVDNNKEKYTVEFSSDICGNTFGIPPGKFDITGKPFYPFLQNLIKEIKEGTFKMPMAEVKTFNFGTPGVIK